MQRPSNCRKLRAFELFQESLNRPPPPPREGLPLRFARLVDPDDVVREVYAKINAQKIGYGAIADVESAIKGAHDDDRR